MSTRATYRIHDSYNDIYVCFYKHHDNYAMGAAILFKNMQQAVKQSQGLMGAAEAFFRANIDVRLTSCQEDHLDTDYHYSLDKNGILTVEKKIDKEEEAEWQPFFEGSVEDFIQKQEDLAKENCMQASDTPIFIKKATECLEILLLMIQYDATAGRLTEDTLGEATLVDSYTILRNYLEDKQKQFTV